MGVRGTADHPLRVAVIGSGPSGFFAVEHLFGKAELHVRVDMFERLPVPFGLVRYGVAPDHQKIKSVVRKFEKLAADPRFRFFGNVEFGSAVSLGDLFDRYDAICIATGTPASRRLGIPGEELDRSHSATEFVAWYNGHPDYRDLEYDFSVERVAVVGIGNVAVDVARIFCRTPEELIRTDIADHALAAFLRSRVREVVLLGRRGPAQAAFTNPEVRELAEMPGADFVVRPGDLELDDVSRDDLERNGDRKTRQTLDTLQAVAAAGSNGGPRKLALRFCVSPLEYLDDGEGRVGGVKLVHNRLMRNGDRVRAVPTGKTELLDAGLVFRAAGYRGLPLPGVPFNDRRGTVPNRKGRVIDGRGGRVIPGLYVAGWIKRGPSGVIGTNKPDSAETVEQILEDAASGRLQARGNGARESTPLLLLRRGVQSFSYADWKRINEAEIARGELHNRPRVKFTSVEECIEALYGDAARADERRPERGSALPPREGYRRPASRTGSASAG
jgi:ferredoxin--NADP+ reductase